jgi:hypothetical protein
MDISESAQSSISFKAILNQIVNTHITLSTFKSWKASHKRKIQELENILAESLVVYDLIHKKKSGKVTREVRHFSSNLSLSVLTFKKNAGMIFDGHTCKLHNLGYLLEVTPVVAQAPEVSLSLKSLKLPNANVSLNTARPNVKPLFQLEAY